jgi:hypothetical protein
MKQTYWVRKLEAIEGRVEVTALSEKKTELVFTFAEGVLCPYRIGRRLQVAVEEVVSK